jgi:outer membrane lipoprotein-sorting protein
MKKMMTIFICSSVLIMSCRKDKTADTAPVNGGFKKVKTVANYYNGNLQGTEAYAYDQQGRISSVTYDKNIHLFEYTGNNEMKVTAKNKSTGDVLWIQTAKLNSKGAITEMVKQNKAGAIIDACYYTYDANGYMVSYKSISPMYHNNVWDWFYVLEGGVIVSAKSYVNGVQYQDLIYEYDFSEVSQVPHTPDFYWLSGTLYGTPLKHPRKSFKVKLVNSETITYHAVYTRSYAGNGSGLEENMQYPLFGSTGSMKYTF